MTIKEALQKGAKILSGKKINSATLDSEIILLYSLSQSENIHLPRFNTERSWLHAHNDYNLAKKSEKKFFGLIERRKNFEPVAYIASGKEFYGLDFYVNKNVLIPRPETEILVEESLKEISALIGKTSEDKIINIADIGTGSGAIAISVAKTLKNSEEIGRAKIYATDISPRALSVAKKNARKHGCAKNIIFKKGDLLKALPKNTKFDFLLANLPYGSKKYHRKISKNKPNSPNLSALKYEPKISIFAKNDGLEYFYKIFPLMPKYLAINSKIFLESDPRQIKTINKLAKKYLPKHKISVIKDLRGLGRITRIDLFNNI